MKQFETLRMTLFDSTNACFRLDVEVKFVASQQQGGRSLVYVTDHGTGFLKPNVYLTLSYREDSAGNTKNNVNISPVYTSYPQLFGLRKMFGRVKEIVTSGDAYIKSDNALTVKADYSEPIIMDNIGKNNNWISLKPCVMQSGENGVFEYTPGVEIKLSTAGPNESSALTVDEFLTICTIIEDIDLTSIQFNASIAYLNAQGSAPVSYPTYQQPSYPQPFYGQPQPNYQQPSYPTNNRSQGYYTSQGARPQPRYGNQNYRGSAPRSNPAPQGQPYSQVAAPQQQQPMEDAPVAMRPRPQASSVVPQQPGLQPREQKPIMNLKAVEDTPVSSIEYDDTAAIDDIFKD